MSRIRTAMERAQLEEEQRVAVEAALRGADLSVPRREITPHAAPGDERRLRGIPVIGGVGGHIPGTRPDQRRIRLHDVR